MSMILTKVNFFNNRGVAVQDSFQIDEYPDSCPICHEGIEPAFRTAWYENGTIAVILMCPKRKCQSLFISIFCRDRALAPGGPAPTIYEFQASYPWIRQEHVFPDEIRATSEMFCTIYNESAEAEQRGLKNICGAGYRKALEFLIKDYLIKDKQKEAEAIRKTFLGSCIKDYIEEGRIKACAERAVWLGNDQTHYDQIWGDKDLEDLKNLIDLTVTWIHSEHVTKQIIKEMPAEKKKKD